MDQGIILVDKPGGMTSFDVIRELRRKLGVRKMGHAGTLDPLATGLLIVGIGDATKGLSRL
ncbi:MAG: tRNA pseudouridine(55) synthase TruB, partial [Candidatus Paceibacterota bacterium]